MYQQTLLTIATLLGGTAEPLHDDANSGSITTDKWQIWVNFDNYRKRVCISCSFPRHETMGGTIARDLMTYDERTNGSELVTEITCALTRTAESIAKDIQRKLLPTATELYSRWVARKTQHENYKAGQQNILQQLAAYGYEGSSHTDRLYARGHENLPTLSVTDSKVRFEAFSCNPAKALAILAILKG